MSRWLSIGLSAALVPVFVTVSAGAVSPVSWGQQEQDYYRPKAEAAMLPQLLAVSQAQERRIALVIGNGKYSENGWLKNPPNDATDIANVLQQLGFEVTLKLNLNQEQMEEEVERFNSRLKQGGVGLFYYAGHAVQTGGENYLIPIGAKINREQDMHYKTVPLGKVLGAMEEAENHLNIVILDACRDNPSLRRFAKGRS